MTEQSTRRQALKRLGVAGAAVAWTTPVVQSISMSAAGAQSGSAAIKAQGGDPLTSIELRYLGGSTAHGTGAPCDGSGSASGTVNGPVTVYAQWGSGGSPCGRLPASNCGTSGANSADRTVAGVNVNDVLRFPAAGFVNMTPRICLLAVDAQGDCTLTQIHTSCSAPINVGDICGQWQVVTATN